MEPLEIQFRLKKLGMSQRKLAAELEVSEGVVSNTIWSRATSTTVAQRIAELLETEPAELWPDNYGFKPRTSRRLPAAKRKTKRKEEGAK